MARVTGHLNDWHGAHSGGSCLSTVWRTKKFEQSIVVLGAGFAGVECARRLHKKLRKRADVHVALVDKNNHSVFQPLLPEVASASIATHHVVNPVRMLARGVDFDCAEVERIDLETRKVHFESPEGMDLMPMPFTHLVIALGLVPNMGVVPGMAAHGLPMQTVGDAYHLRDHVLGCLELAANTSDSELRRELLTVVTVGAGFSGVETCAEVHDMLTSALRYFPELQSEKIHSVLVSSTERILPALSPSLSDYALKKLRKRGVEVLLQARTTSVTPRSCFLKDGTEIRTRSVISTVGFSPHPVVLATALEKDKGRLVVDELMRCKGHDDVWAIGDCAVVVNAVNGKPSPPTAQFAVRQGIQLADNIVRALRGQALRPFAFRQLGYAASLGHLSAVVEIGSIRLSGFIAWWIWRTIYLLKLPGFYRRMRVVVDWSVSLLFPRDITTISTRQSERVAREHYEPGQVIVREGDRGDSFYTIVSGEVDVVKRTGSDGEEKLVARLGPGTYFGEEALLTGKPRSASVKALSACDVLVLGRSDFRALADNLKLLGDTFKKVRKPLEAVEATRVQHVRKALARMKVSDRMVGAGKLVTLQASQTLEQMCRTFHDHGYDVFPLLDGGKLAGLLAREDLQRALNSGLDPHEATCGDLGGAELVTCHPDDDLAFTMDRFHQHECDRMLVVDERDPSKLLGMLTITDLLQARIELELVLSNPATAKTLKLPEHVLEKLHA